MSTCKRSASNASIASMEDVNRFGERVREARSACGWTQWQLAVRAGIKPMEVSNYERGVSRPKMDRQVLLAQVLGVSTAWLVFGVGER